MARGKTTAIKVADEVDEFDVGEGETIPAQVDLRSKAKEVKLRPGQKDPIQAAEAAMKRMERTFSVWIEDESEMLVDSYRAAEAAGFAGAPREDLYRRAHDIKGQAATLGFPVAGRIAGTLCLLLDHAGDRIPAELVRQHVQAIRAIVREDARDEDNAIAVKLASRLDDVTGEYIGSL